MTHFPRRPAVRLAALFCSALLPLTFCSLLALLLVLPAAGQNLNVHMTASSEILGPEDRTTYVLTTSNTGPSDLTDVSVEVQLPASINRLAFPPADFSCSAGCDAGETAMWTVGTLGPGESQTVFYQAQIQSTASAGPITSSATGSATGTSDAMASLDVEIDDSPLLRLSLAPESGPAVADVPFTYTLTFGNVGTTNPDDVLLTMAVPTGTNFVSATDGGVETSGVVTWDVGLLGVGASRQVQVTVRPDASLDNGAVIEARAEIDPNEPTESVASSSAATPVREAGPLRLEYALSQSAIEPGSPATYTLTASNTGPVDLTDASARILLPGFIDRINYPPVAFSCSAGCDANEIATWAIGTLSPGESRMVVYRSFAQSAAPQGELLRSQLTATSSNTGQVSAALDAQVDPSPLLHLDLMPGEGPATAEVPFTYTLTIGNVGNKNPTDVALALPVPDETSFVAATGGGTLNGGVVTWDVGLLGVGQSRQVQLTVRPNAGRADGSLIEARATLDPGDANEIVMRSSAVTPIRSDVPLRITYGVNSAVPGQDDYVDVSLTATNTGPVDLTNASARILFPEFMDRINYPPAAFSCSAGCDANEVATWTIGTLSLGESRSVFFRTKITDDAPQGEVLRSTLTATGSGTPQISTAFALSVDPSPLLRLSIASDPSPAVAGNSFTYLFTVGNVGNKAPSGIVLSVLLPEGTNFVSATDGGTLQNDTVTWTPSAFGNGAGGTAELTVLPDGSLPDGSLLYTRAWLDSGDGTEVVNRASIVTPVRSGASLSVDYTADVSAVEPGDAFTYTLTMTNTGPVDLTDASARVLFPDFIERIPAPAGVSCSAGCDANEAATWTVGTLPAGQSAEIELETTVRNGEVRGNVLRSLVLGTSTGSNEGVARQDLLLGNERPLPVELASFTGTAAGESVTLRWTTASETNNAGFDVERSLNGTSFATIGHRSGHGTTTEAQSYRFADRTPPFADTLVYRLRQVDLDGTHEYSPVAKVAFTPQRFALLPNAPNPFRDATRLRYTLTADATVTLEVYDLMGRRVTTLVDGKQPAGHHTATLTGTGLAPGTYFVRLRANDQTATQRVAVVR